MQIEVRDDGAGGATSDGLGHGLVGIRERVKIYGGEMNAGRAPAAASSSARASRSTGTRAMSIRVLVADDQSMVRAGFRMLLAGEEDIEVVAEASNGLEAVDKAARFDPTVVLMDIRMPELDGLEATRRILAADDDRAGPDPDDVRPRRVRLRGAPRRRQRLRAEGRPARAAARRDPHRRRRRRAPLARRHEARDRAVHAHAPPAPPTELDELTERELDVFRLIARGLSNAEIGKELYISDTTVKTHITHILQKLDLRGGGGGGRGGSPGRGRGGGRGRRAAAALSHPPGPPPPGRGRRRPGWPGGGGGAAARGGGGRGRRVPRRGRAGGGAEGLGPRPEGSRGEARLDGGDELVRRRCRDPVAEAAAHDRPTDGVQLERPAGVEVLLHRGAHLAAGETEKLALQLLRIEARTLCERDRDGLFVAAHEAQVPVLVGLDCAHRPAVRRRGQGERREERELLPEQRRLVGCEPDLEPGRAEFVRDLGVSRARHEVTYANGDFWRTRPGSARSDSTLIAPASTRS